MTPSEPLEVHSPFLSNIFFFLGGGGVTCLAMVYVCYCNDCDDNKSSKLNKQQKFVQTGNKTTEEESTKYQ